MVIVGPKGKYYGASVAGPVFKEVVGKVYATFLEPRSMEDPLDEKLPSMKSGSSEDIIIASRELNIDLPSDAGNAPFVNIKKANEKLDVVKLNVADGIVPNVLGMGGKDALYLLESSGLKVKMAGFGKVKKQSVKAGRKIKKGQTIYIDLG